MGKAIRNALLYAAIIILVIMAGTATTEPQKTDPQVTICDVLDNKKAIMTFTSDDGLYDSVVKYNEIFKKYNIKGTIAVNTSTVTGENNIRITSTWQQWRDLLKDNRLDIANHTHSHTRIPDADNAKLEYEINDAQRELKNELPGQQIISMCNPFVSKSDRTDEVIKQNHYSARNGEKGFNSLSPTANEWYRLNYQYVVSNTKEQDMNRWVDSAIKNSKWLIEVWHGIDGDDWEPSTYEICDGHLKYVAGKKELWIATLSDVTKYIQERQDASIEIQKNNNNLTLKVSHTLNPEIFNHPLTVKIAIDKNVKSAVAIQNGNLIDCRIEDDGLFLNVVPSNDKILIRLLQ